MTSPHPCEFAFHLFQPVAFAGDTSMRGTVLGRMEDKNGRRYEVRFEHEGKVQRGWYPEDRLTEAPEEV